LSKWKVSIGITFLLVALICAILAAFVTKAAKARYNTEHIVFAMNDPEGDDYGPGTYKYPISSIFDPKKGHFDLLKFSLSSQRNTYHFDMTFPVVTNPWGAAEGFSQTMIQIYIVDDPDKGRIETFREGANIIFDPQSPWRYLIKVVSFNKSSVYWDSDFEGADGRYTGVRASLQPDKKTVRVSVPKPLLPGDPYEWRFYVLIGSQDGMGPDNFRVVNAEIGQWTFGGGTDTDYDPNVIDILAPKGRQEKMLGSYNPAERLQAIVEPVGPARIKLTREEKFLDRIIAVLQKMKVKL